jgi:hypothetical protein
LVIIKLCNFDLIVWQRFLCLRRLFASRQFFHNNLIVVGCTGGFVTHTALVLATGQQFHWCHWGYARGQLHLKILLLSLNLLLWYRTLYSKLVVHWRGQVTAPRILGRSKLRHYNCFVNLILILHLPILVHWKWVRLVLWLTTNRSRFNPWRLFLLDNP